MSRGGAAAASAVAITALAFGLRAADASAVGSIALETFVGVLVAAAALCVAGLAHGRAPALLGFSLGAAALLAAIEAIAVIRAWLRVAPAAEHPALVAVAGLAAIASTFVTWGFAVDRLGRGPASRRGTQWTFLAVAVVALGFASALVAAATESAVAGPDEVTPLRFATRVMLVVSAGALLVGAWLVVLPRLGRAARRAVGPGGAGWADALLHEFLPAIGARRRAADVERERLAADLHARVLPGLRQAVAGTTDPTTSARVRDALDEVEQLMASRHSVTLESFGLVAALEWLAERTETRAGVAAELAIDPATTDVRPPREVERAAFRVALLAVDNAVRHAPGSPIAIAALAAPRRVSVQVEDDGPGLPDVPAGGEHRGLADLRAEAEGVRARITIGPRAGHPGTAVTFEWTG